MIVLRQHMMSSDKLEVGDQEPGASACHRVWHDRMELRTHAPAVLGEENIHLLLLWRASSCGGVLEKRTSHASHRGELHDESAEG